jgi:2'-hydroxyisoflavone reductase
VAAFALNRAEVKDGSIYNVTSRRFTFGALLETCIQVSGSGAQIHWIEEDKLLAAELAPWTDIPLWIPRSDDVFRSIMEVNVERAHAVGLRMRPLDETLRDVLVWDRGRRDVALKTGIPLEKETALLKSQRRISA